MKDNGGVGDGKPSGNANSTGRTIGDVLYNLLLGDNSPSGCWQRFVSMVLGFVVLHFALFVISSAVFPVTKLGGIAIILAVSTIVNFIFFAIVCKWDKPRGHLTRYFTLGALLPGSSYLLAGLIIAQLMEIGKLPFVK